MTDNTLMHFLIKSLKKPLLRYKSNRWPISLGIGILSFLIAFYNLLGQEVFNLGNILFDVSGDGLKNYFTFAHYHEYGRGWWFNGFLYPHEELALYADAQPLLVWVIWTLKYIGLNFSNHLLWVLNILPILSFPLGSIFLYKVFRHYKCDHYYSLLLAIMGMMLSPQLHKIQAHYALSYGFIIPAIWYALIKTSESKILSIPSISMIAGISLLGFVHPYLLLISSVFTLFWFLSYGLVNKSWHWSSLTGALCPPIIFNAILAIIDPFKDRPSNPYGLLSYNTTWSDLFPFYKFGWNEQGFYSFANFSEGMAYVGCLLFLVPLILLYEYFQKGQTRKLFYNTDHSSVTWNTFLVSVVCAFFSLIFASGLHIYLTGGLIVDIFEPLKQFRTLGRFSWIYYYLGFTLVAVFIHEKIKLVEGKGVKGLIFLFAVMALTFEIGLYHNQIKQVLEAYSGSDILKQNTQIGDLLKANKRNSESYQALITLPPSTEGSEKLYTQTDYYTKTYALPYSYQTNTPLTACILSRTPLSNLMTTLQFYNSAYGQKNVVINLSDERFFLIMCPNEKIDEYSDYLSMATRIDSNQHITLYEISKDSLSGVTGTHTADYVCKYGLDIDKSMYDSYANHKDSKGLLDNSALFLSAGSSWLLDQAIEQNDTGLYELSFWQHLQHEKSDVPTFTLSIHDVNKEIRVQESFRDLDISSFEVYDNWVRMSKWIELHPGDSHINLTASGQNHFFDHVLLRPSQYQHCVQLDENHFLDNGYIVQLKR